jgi:dTDP-4-amino-4,6-dideoxygalactose transaminase
MIKIPFVDLKAQYNSIKSEVDSAIKNIIEETSFIGGPSIREFEKKFAEMLGVKHCIGVANGTDAIYIALRMLGVGRGDEVITSASSWISTSETITQTGATPVFVDIEKDTFTIDVNAIERAISKKTKAIIPVHLYGQAADILQIKALCDKHNLFLIEDCAQSHFTKYRGLYVGTFGNAATFSFYPGKNLGAYGDAGAIVTDDDQLAHKMRMYANHGALKKHEHEMEGINSRLDTLQAAILRIKLPHIHEWTKMRIHNAALYSSLLKDIKNIAVPVIKNDTVHTFHLYVIRTTLRNELKTFLEKHGIQTAIHYPTALPNLPAYSYLNYSKIDFPIASTYQDQILSLPMYPELTREQIQFVCDTIKQFFIIKH